MKKRKILVFNLTPRSGMLHYSSQFCNELLKRKDINLRIVIASYYNENLYNKDIKFFKIRTNPSLVSFIFDSCNIFYHVYFLFQIIKFRPHIIHFIDNHPWYVFYIKIFKLLGVQVYVTQHDPTLHSGETKNLVGKVAGYTNKILRNNADKIIVHGDILKGEVIQQYNIPKEKLTSIPHGAYTFFKDFSRGLETQKDTFLFFGRILDYKGLDTLLKSLYLVQQEYPNFQLIIAGPGDISGYKKQLQKYKRNIKLYNFNIEAKDIYKYFEISEFTVLPYHDATGSGVIPVSYCFKKPVIVTNVGELSSVVEDTKTGIILKNHDSLELGEQINNLLKNKKETQKMGEYAYEYSLKKLSWKPIINKIYG